MKKYFVEIQEVVIAELEAAIEVLGGREAFSVLCNPETAEEAENASKLINQHLKESVVFPLENDGVYYICGIIGQYDGRNYMPNAISTAQYKTSTPMYDYAITDYKVEFTGHNKA